MMLNKYDRKYKHFICLQKELQEVREKIRAIPWIPYDKPVPSGWLVNYELRDDIKRREDANYILEAMKVAYKPQYISSVKHVRMMRAGQKGYWTQNWKGHRYYVKFCPMAVHLKQKEYDKLSPQVQKYFYLDRWNSNHWYRDKYHGSFPDYWLVPKARTRYLTHYRDIDPDLMSRAKELGDMLDGYWRIYDTGYRRDLPHPVRINRNRERDAIHKFQVGESEDVFVEKVPRL